jgi:hypothetical protein
MLLGTCMRQKSFLPNHEKCARCVPLGLSKGPSRHAIWKHNRPWELQP